jgi:hypothetical protein
LGTAPARARTPAVTATELVAVLGLVSGVTGTVLGVLNSFATRHASSSRFNGTWRRSETLSTTPTKPWGVVTVTNVGRRAVRVSHVALRLPKGHDVTHLLHPGSVQGKTLTEASPAEVFVVSQDDLGKFATDWREVKVEVSDSHRQATVMGKAPVNYTSSPSIRTFARLKA